MKIQFRYRSMVLAALAISLLAIAGFPQTASAGASNANNARSEIAAEKKAEAKGQGGGNDAPSAGTPTAGDDAEGPTTHDGDNGPAGQTCDGDPSGHSDTDNGANGNGDDYDNTCEDIDPAVGAPNGAGDGQATGKPCEGCVGAADDKNPAGQADSGPSDANNGYECDEKGRSAREGNNGVGYGNPAHTGCEPSGVGPACVPTSSQNPDCTPKCVPTATQDAQCNEVRSACVPTATQDASCNETCPAGKVMHNGSCENPPCVAGVDAACSQSTPSCVESAGGNRCGGAAAVLGETLGRTTDVLGVSIEAPSGAVAPAALARTGGFELTALVQAGLVLAGLGLGLTVLGRRRRLATVDIAARLGE